MASERGDSQDGSVDDEPKRALAAYTLQAESGTYRITGHPVGFIVEGPLDSPDGHRVDSHPASGGRASSKCDGLGNFSAEFDEPLLRGKHAEEHALKVLVMALRGHGNTVERLPGSQDDRGEDALLMINGHRTTVQVVTLPIDASIWRELSSGGETAFQGDVQDAVGLVRAAFVHKRAKTVGVVLLLDAAHIGAIVSNRLRVEYWASFGDPAAEFSLAEAWIVGPTPRSAVCLGASASHAVA